MGLAYADVVDKNEIEKIVGTQYTNKIKFNLAGLVDNMGPVSQGTNPEWIRETLFQGDRGGQAIGINTEISLKNKEQAKYQIPKVFRSDGAYLDKIFDEINPKSPRDMETDIVNGVLEKSQYMAEEVMVSVLNGFGKYAKANTTNYVDDKSNQVTFNKIVKAKASRGDQGQFTDGVIVANSADIHKLVSLGTVAATSNTAGAAAQNAVIERGTFVQGTVLGMNLLMDDRISVDADDSKPFFYLMEKGAFKAKYSNRPSLEPIVPAERKMGEIVKFYISIACGIHGMSWSGGSSDLINNTDLATAASWSLAVVDAKYVPVAVLATAVSSI